MRLIQPLTLLAGLACLACLPMAAAQELPAQPPQATVTATMPRAAEAAQPDTSKCTTKGCPERDQHGNPPVSCGYQYGMATGFKCILMCTYKNSTWGTIVATSNCD